MSILEVENVRFRYRSRYQQVDALKGVTYQFEQGKVYGLIGKSGSGKSTLLSLLAGLDLPQEGEIRFEGVPTAKMELNRYRREKAAVIYQSFRLFPLLTVQENVTYPMELRGFGGKAAREKAKELISRVNLPETALNRYPSMLSGGEQQRVAIARALSMDTKLLLADEPTGNLDTENGDRIIDILVQLAHEEKYCVIIATHDMDILPRLDEACRVVDGKLIRQSTVSQR
ncbi:MAG: ABC transporter ATP-binding protein [Oscillospiraceae bacterium]|nr:ABC transporter ATP-binding protein [Oscillospiraceae bacterium]